MSRCRCTDDHECNYCRAGIDAIEDARAGKPWGWSQRDLDFAADAAAADMVYGREW